MKEIETLVNPLLDLCLSAGESICSHYATPESGEFRAKSDETPLTLADLASDRILQAGLTKIAPGVPVLSEESTAAIKRSRHAWERYWLVDPLDGTKEFLGRTGEFTINVALIDGHKPTLGVIYLPLEAVAYVGIPGAGARRYHHVAGEGWTDSALAARALPDNAPVIVLASRRHQGAVLKRCLAWLERERGPFERCNSGSALKFCQLASGSGDFYPRFSRCCEWDTAAGQALVEAVGGAVLGMDGKPLRYNLSDSLYSPHFFALADAGHPLWQRLLRESPAFFD